MSNLYKQYNTLEPEKSIRVIDYNAMVEQKLAELVKKQRGTEEAFPDSFQSLGTIAEEPAIESPEELLAKAKEEAGQILSQAKEESERLIDSAQMKSQEILDKAREDGHREGYEEGGKQVREELEAEYDRRKEELERLKLELQEDYNQEMQTLEPKLLDVILTVVEKVFHIQFEDKKEILLYLIGNTIANIEGCKSFRIRVGEEQKNFLEYHKEEISDRIGHDMSLEILSDVSLEGNQCVIETDTGIFDCSLGVQLENLIKDLRSLSS